ncbi:beta-lactamase/transpeptidase-like protein [Obba rivulosa]|uniref:Beta-lactamase/transpeptidase-like protein n=1 Tax=Obba rivulosa TaxID=1052685 RepID=A0A8E2AVD5_9APHY|nr:beta-lactamase/transpeptidase-like protein [Obba rivulosa]
MQTIFTLLSGIVSAVLRYSGPPATDLASHHVEERINCFPFLPKLFTETPPPADDPFIQTAAQQVHQYLSDRFSVGDISSLSVAVVTADGAVFEENYGVMRANESDTSPPTHRHSMYRVASVSKLFAVLEGHVLAQKGVLSWDDPVRKHLPDFSYRLDGFRPGSKSLSLEYAPITLFQLASHMSGLGRDLPSGIASGFPHVVNASGPPPTNGLPFLNRTSLLNVIANSRLVSPPFAYPSYSNTATGLLGLTLVAANRAASHNASQEPETYAELVKRDVFQPLGLNGSHFLATPENRHLLVVSTEESDIVDVDFTDNMNSAGGQFLSLSDAITVLQTLLNPDNAKSILTRYSMNRWMQPVHDFEEDNWTQVGHIWEIVKARDSNGRLRKVYWKLGNLPGYHAAIAIHPGTSYGVAILMSGQYADAAELAYKIFGIFQPAIDAALAQLASDLYSGTWKSQDGDSSAFISVENGTLFMNNLVLNGTDVLPIFGVPGRVALRSTERRDELRLDIGSPNINGKIHYGCMPYWNVQDDWALRNGVPINLLYFTGDGESRILHYPSVDVTMGRSL